MSERFTLATKPFLQAIDTGRIREFAELLKQVQESAKTLPSRTRKALLTIAKHGWFFDLQMPANGIWELESALAKGNIKEAEQALTEYYRKNINSIEESITSLFPKRGKIVTAAFNAHRRGEYELSIPVFLIQADGICNELFGIQLWKMRSDNKEVIKYLQKIGMEKIWEPLLHPLTQLLPISARASERGERFHELNRHLVLHGDSIDYGAEVNSLKAISLLNYVAVVLNESGKWSKSKNAA